MNAIINKAELNKMTGAELVSLHNKLAAPLGKRAVRRFATKTAAQARTWALVQASARTQQERTQAQRPARTKTAAAKPAQPAAAPATAKRSRARGTNIQPTGEPLRACRAGSKQAILLDLLRQPEGATIETLMAATGWQRSSVRTGFSWDMRGKGYGVRSTFDAAGVERFHLVVPVGQKVPAHVAGRGA